MTRSATLFACALLCLIALSATTMFAEDSIQVTVTGTLKTGIVAIGGETTGTTITAGKVTWELDFAKNDELRAAAEKLNGQPVTVTGSLEKRPGVEVKERWIVTVATLKSAAEKKATPHTTGLEAREVREGTKVTLAGNAEQAIVDIQCERGIDRCALARQGEQWPKRVTFRLHLSGLESFQVKVDDTSIAWAVSSTGKHESSSSITMGKETRQLQPGDDFHTVPRLLRGGETIQVLETGEGAKSLILPTLIEVPLPAKLLESNPKQLQLQWIDFYR